MPAKSNIKPLWPSCKKTKLMKKYYVIFAIFILAFFKSELNAQTYVPFPNSNAVWNVLEFYPLSSSWYDSIWNNTSHYGLFGDTLINSQNYHQLFYNNGLSDSTIEQSSINTIYCGAIREEISTKKIYYLPKDSLNENLCYDFNLNLHDTIIINGNTFVCNSINTILINNQYRKRYDVWSITTMTGDHWIEGIGSSNGLLYPFYYPILDTIKYGLLCFKHNDTLIYQMDGYLNYWPIPSYLFNSGCYQKELYTTTSFLIKSNDLRFIVYPNPITDKSILKIKNNFTLTKSSIEIYDSQGLLVKKIKIIVTNEIYLDKSEFNSGLYFMKIIKENNVYTGNFIVL